MVQLTGTHEALQEAITILLVSARDGFVQVTVFVAIAVLLFSYGQFRTNDGIIPFLETHDRIHPIVGALLGLVPGCGGAVIVVPLYIRGTVSFGTVVAALAATAGDSAFVLLALAPEAAVYVYGLAFVAAVTFGYAIDIWGLGVARVDNAISHMSRPIADGGFVRNSVFTGGPDSPPHQRGQSERDHFAGWSDSDLLTALTNAVHVLWWIAVVAGLIAIGWYLVRGGPDVTLEVAPTFSGLFTVAGLIGVPASFYLYFIGRRYIGDGAAGQMCENYTNTYETFHHAAMEASLVTVWVIGGFLIYEYSVALFDLDLGALAAGAGVFAPIGGALLGFIPSCAPGIVLVTLYAEGQIPFSALTANAISQDGDALFPLLATDMKAAIIAVIYTTIPSLIVGIGLYYVWPYANFGFGVLG